MFLQLCITVLGGFAWKVSNISKSSDRPGLAWQFVMKNEPGKFSTVGFLLMFWVPLVCAATRRYWQCTLAKASLLISGLFLALGCWGDGTVSVFRVESTISMQREWRLLARLIEWELKQICFSNWSEYTKSVWGSLHHGFYLQQNETMCKGWVDLGEARTFANSFATKSHGASLISACLLELCGRTTFLSWESY